MSSLYGTLPTTSFAVKASYASVDEMYERFKKGPDYTDVWYGEYCLIDTPNKNNPDNGKLYRRGLNYTHVGADNVHDGGAEYVGQLVGGSTGTPWFTLESIASIQDVAQKEVDGSVYEELQYPVADGDSWKVYVDGEGGAKTVYVFSQDARAVEGDAAFIVPGKTEDGKFNDEFRYTWANDRTQSDDNDSTYHAGFQVPYPVVEVAAEYSRPYNEDGEYAPSVTAVLDSGTEKSKEAGYDDGEYHAFYRHYTFTIPDGVKGDSVRGVRQTVVGKDDVFYIDTDLSYEDGKLVVGEPSYNKDGSKAGKTVIVYDLAVYDTYEDPRDGKGQVTVYLGEYDHIVSADIAADGGVTYGTLNGETITLQTPDGKTFAFRSIDDVKLSGDDELFEDKRIKLKYSTDDSYTSLGDGINYIQEMCVDPQNFHLMVLYNDPEHRVSPKEKDVVNDSYTDASGNSWKRNIDLETASAGVQKLLNWDANTGSYTDTSVSNSVFWRDYGSIHDASGVMVGLYVESSEIDAADKKEGPTNDEVVAYLNEKYAGGLTYENTGDATLVGKIVAVGENQKNKRFFAYSYGDAVNGYSAGWFYLGTTAAVDRDTIDAKLVDTVSDATWNEVSQGGVMLVKDATDTNATELPRWWDPTYDGGV
jgi:hypothetical protein